MSEETEILRDIERAAGLVEPEPHDLEAERAVLGAVLLGNGIALEKLSGWLRPSHFYREQHRVTWAGMLDLHGDRAGVDVITLTDHLRRTGRLEEAGGRVAIDELCGVVPAVANFAEYGAIVRRLAQWRRRGRAVYALGAAVAERDDVKYRDALERAT